MPGTGANSWVNCTSGAGGSSGDCALPVVELSATAPDGGTGGQTFTRDIAVPGAVVGQYGAIQIQARGDLDNSDEILTVTDLTGGAFVSGTPGTRQDFFQTWVSHFAVELGDIGGGVAGVRLQIGVSAGVASVVDAMPNNWTWQIQILGVFA